MDYDILLKNARVWTGETFLPGVQSVAVAGGKIAEIGACSGKATYTVDVQGHILSPGLIDSHVHIRGCSPDAFSIGVEAVGYPFGVTAAVEASASKPEGSRILDNTLMKTYVFVAAQFAGKVFLEEKTDALVAAYGDRVLGVKVFFDTCMSMVTPGEIEPLLTVCRYARRRGLRVLVHSTRSPVPMAQLLDALAPGDICTHIFHNAEHNVREDDFACLAKAKARGVILDDGMAGGGHTDFNMIRQALEKGITPNTVSTDITPGTAFRRGGCYGLSMCMSVLRSLGLEEETVLRMVTGNAARAIGKEQEIGFLEVGRSADLCVLKYGAMPFKITSGGGGVTQSELGYVNLLTLCRGTVMFRSLQNEI